MNGEKSVNEVEEEESARYKAMKTTQLLHKISTNTKSTHHKTRGSPYTERKTFQIDRKDFREVDELYRVLQGTGWMPYRYSLHGI